MGDNDPVAAVTPLPALAAAKPVLEAAKKSKKKPDRKADAKNESAPRQTGRVVGLDVKVDPAGQTVVGFSLKTKKGKPVVFAAPSRDTAQVAAMVAILSAALASGSKVHVECAAATNVASRIALSAK